MLEIAWNAKKHEILKNYSSKKNIFPTPEIFLPPPPNFFFTPFFFLNVGNSMKRLENMKFWKKKNFKFYFFKYLKNSYKIQATFHQYQKLYSTPPSLGARTCKVSRQYSNAFLSYSAKTKRDGRTDRQTDRQTDRRTDRRTDGQTDGRGALQYLPSPGLRRRREIIKSSLPMPSAACTKWLFNVLATCSGSFIIVSSFLRIMSFEAIHIILKLPF